MLIATFDFNIILFTVVIIVVILFVIFRIGGWFKKK